jgi:hypothetical protein
MSEQHERMSDPNDSFLESLILELCNVCKQQFPRSKMFTYWHSFGGIRVCSDCLDKLGKYSVSIK